MTGTATTPPTWRVRWPVVALAVVVLAACFAYALSRHAASSDDGVPPSRGTLVTYVVEGGFAGIRTEITVSADGTATVDGLGGADTRRLDDQRLADLRSALDAAAFGELAADYRHQSCADCFVHTITYRGHSVTVEDGAAPRSLSEVLRLLGEVAAA